MIKFIFKRCENVKYFKLLFNELKTISLSPYMI